MFICLRGNKRFSFEHSRGKWLSFNFIFNFISRRFFPSVRVTTDIVNSIFLSLWKP